MLTLAAMSGQRQLQQVLACERSGLTVVRVQVYKIIVFHFATMGSQDELQGVFKFKCRERSRLNAVRCKVYMMIIFSSGAKTSPGLLQ